MSLRWTAEGVHQAPVPAAVTGASNLLEWQGLSDNLLGFALKALHVDIANPEHSRLFDGVGKVKGPPACKQLYRQYQQPSAPGQPPPASRWSLVAVSAWPPHQYGFHAYPSEGLRALKLAPGAYVLHEAELGQPVGPSRAEVLPDFPPAIVMASGNTGSVTTGTGQVKAKGKGKRARAPEAGGSASDTTLSTQDTQVTAQPRRPRLSRAEQ
mmetsp:Transcript_10354/g.17991  ORF Transcript_10354/g.17991 Transcript_10354/m.17991 type:complete len:211 (+) Transcript_10354:266-898(+)|eukprot:CAMPEP_0119111816 /NCGR_PEP_ID=MMETSP1180-20130426/37473_1 /TAXON_ID=3052 ORGANISM="Chlamydomonas cf sp, Strain CCMP681" /NCGR_SAMPLE_ID=MMETSP1180 /ASSEMBLY_ACC=CAM_ASM_000741 /LENGTH=210 /DNA_ID=CAMNT_0007099017 /DNA_START=251 /DNA_END=883 /DNA_ORIENTATION=+